MSQLQLIAIVLSIIGGFGLLSYTLVECTYGTNRDSLFTAELVVHPFRHLFLFPRL